MNNNVTIAQIKEALKVWELLGVNESALGEVEINVINTIMNSAPYLVATLEDAQRENERLCTEHTAMKEALEWINRNEGNSRVTDVAEDALQALQCPTE